MAIQDNKAYAFTGEQLKDYSNRFAYAVDNRQNRVEKANDLYSPTNPTDTDSFIFRTTAGSISIETGTAKILSIQGNTILNNYVDSVLTMTTSFSDEEASASIDKDVWETVVYATSTYEYLYSNNNWHYNGINVTLEDYGITFSGTPTDGDTIRVEYTQPVIGTLTTATPGALHATGFNQYDSTAGYAHVKGGNLYRVAGASTTTGAFATTPEGTQTTIALEDGRFTPAEDGYFFPSSPTAGTLVALVWSGVMDAEPYSAYEVSTVVLPVVDKNNTALPTASYGMPSVRGTYDELDFENNQYIQRIGYYAYSAPNLATVRALKTPYVYDNESIFYVLTSPITFTLADDVSGEYTANDFGTEEFTETEAPVRATIEYGANLVDKLRNLAGIQEIGDGLSLDNGTLSTTFEGIKTLTTADYNYPASNPTRINKQALPDGIYIAGEPVTVLSNAYGSVLNLSTGGMFIKSSGSYLTHNSGSNRWTFQPTFSTVSAYNILDVESIVNNLTSTSAVASLSANQGRILNEKIGDLSSLTTTTKTSTVAAINELNSNIAGETETLAIATSDWTALASSSPYTYSATVSVTATIGANSTVELLNDQPVLFSTYGFAIGAVDTTNNTVTIYSIGQPDANVSLNINIKG